MMIVRIVREKMARIGHKLSFNIFMPAGVRPPPNFHGVKGKSGRKSYARADLLKGILLTAVIEDCERSEERKLFWAEKFANKLLPQTVEGTGDNGSITIKLIQFAGD